MMKHLPHPFSLATALCGSALAATSQAGTLTLKVEIPQLKVSEYHRPYVALWLETADQEFAANLAHWYDLKMQNNKGQEWLKDMRAWWRKSGRSLQFPVDGVSAATRAPGTHELVFSTGKAPLKDLPAGEYRLVVEAAREVGGRELVAIPFSWPAKAKQSQSTSGTHELGAISLHTAP